MITSRELIKNLEETIDMLHSDYTPAQWSIKEEIDTARYRKASKVYEEANHAISNGDIIWNEDSDEDYEVISQFIENLCCDIELMEYNLGIY